MKCNDEISIGDYVRTDNGIIIKYQFLEESENFEVFFGQKGKGFTFEDMEEFEDFINQRVVKHSKDIIDLIEEGDYVNGYKVLYVCNEEPCPSGKYVDIDCNKPSEETYFFENEIKSIITKEQIKQIEYRIKE